jgi:hypothetical protein
MYSFLPSHIAYYIKFNYYLISLIIGRVTHPLASLSSTSSSVFYFILLFSSLYTLLAYQRENIYGDRTHQKLGGHILARKNWTTISHALEPKCDPPIFDVFYLHKYSHAFSNFNDIIIQLFQKTSIMTMGTLSGIIF